MLLYITVLQPVGQGPEESEYFSASRLGDLSSSHYTRTVKGNLYKNVNVIVLILE